MDCIFCKIVNKEIPANVVYEDASTIAFLDINPINPGHTLVIPKKHFVDIKDTSDDVLSQLIKTTRKIADALSKMADGVNIGQNNGKAAGQLVMHVHFHVIPRYDKDGLKHWPGKSLDKEEARKIIARINEFLKN